MNLLKKHHVLFITAIIVFSLIVSSGCITDQPTTYNGDNNIDAISGDENDAVLEELSPDNMSLIDNMDLYSSTYTASIKRTGILELENNYSLKVLTINKDEGKIRVSLRKDGNEYASGSMLVGSTYNVKDTNDLNVIYSVHVNSILDNSFFVELTYTVRPEITLEVDTYEGKVIESDLKINEDTIVRTYRWYYENTEFVVEYEYNIEAYDSYSERSRNREFTHFVNDPYDDELISQISSQLGELAEEKGYSRNDIPYIAMTFVQSLPYVSDSASAGYDEYPRFPFETLYHGGGDCEDSSILLASLLYDMGYGVALIELPGHMAVGVKGNSALEGSYYEYSGIRYYYLETTNSGWDVGVIPDEYADFEGTVVPISEGHPELSIGFSGTGKSIGQVTYVDLDIEVENVGSISAKDLVIYATLETSADGMVWDDLETDTGLDLAVDEKVTYSVSDLHVPAGQIYRVGIWAWGDNAGASYVYSDWSTA
ncbi:hypothetical protein [Methanolobus profundi]|uniref:Transglutaminase-like superfamily protein n=1 Tax=Methanolobus profundi TaxID=487685 RepID=A0A1I4PPX2_9EURY|nr:hypothetical protein [Methanolobus profundi]SFM29754.1 hypothetical protein SAMN04488696_0813 [Methanolobus profundi]